MRLLEVPVMVEPRLPQSTVRFVDNYCRVYQHLFSDVRSFEAFTSLHLGLVAPLPRKSLPAIAKAVGLPNDQVLHHFLTHSPWQVEAVRYQRLSLILEQIQQQPIVLVLDDTGDRKKGKTTDYVDRQYIGNVGKVDNGMVSVNAYGVLGDLTFPLLFKVFKPRRRLQSRGCLPNQAPTSPANHSGTAGVWLSLFLSVGRQFLRRESSLLRCARRVEVAVDYGDSLESWRVDA